MFEDQVISLRGVFLLKLPNEFVAKKVSNHHILETKPHTDKLFAMGCSIEERSCANHGDI